MHRILFIFFVFSQGLSVTAQKTVTTDVLVVGGGTGGTAAGIQSARLGAKTVIVEPTPWLGGMISAAGVSATDGNHRLPSGLWSEFRASLYKVYGGAAAVQTGWVSNTLFEPHVADSILKAMAAKERCLGVYYNYSFQGLKKAGTKISYALFRNKKTGATLKVTAKIFIDATELGDVMKAAGVDYDLGMEADSITHEGVGVEKSNEIVQDLTYVATLKDFGEGADRTIAEPRGYDPSEFDAACTDYYNDHSRKAPTVDARKMIDYGRLPHGKYMINWPTYGNDTYLDVVEMSEAEREAELVKAKETTLRFIYFIQHQLGFKNLGLADDEFPTKDHLALIPYYREGRRAKGLVRLTMRNIADPFAGDPLYRTGISVGDYPIDHHHRKNSEAPQHLSFYPVPSFNVPLGALIPKTVDNLIMAEKGISVSNVVNGTTRLQPCVLLTGQAAGALAALSSNKGMSPKQVPVRLVQQMLLKAKAYIMPYVDITPDSRHWEAVQKIGATGILKGVGMPDKWANKTFFYPDSPVHSEVFISDLNAFEKGSYQAGGDQLRIEEAIVIASQLNPAWFTQNRLSIKKTGSTAGLKSYWNKWGLEDFDTARQISRLELAVLLENTVDPFSIKAVDHKGYYQTK